MFFFKLSSVHCKDLFNSGLASLASFMVADATSSSSRLLSASTLESFHSEPTEKDILPEFPCFMTKGGVSLDRPPTIPPANPLPPKFKCEGIEGKGFHKIMIYSRDYLNISSAQRHSCCSITKNERMIMIWVTVKIIIICQSKS